jgi:hypothetical protein
MRAPVVMGEGSLPRLFAPPESEKAPLTAGFASMRPEGFEPSTLGLRVPCSTN